MVDCKFCDPKTFAGYMITENDYFNISWDPFPVSPGHALIVPKRHLVSITNLLQNEWMHLGSTIRTAQTNIESTDLESLYKKFLENPLNDKSAELCQSLIFRGKPNGYNIGINEGEAAGQTINHLHIHIIPRYDDDVPNPRDGVRHIIPGKGLY